MALEFVIEDKKLIQYNGDAAHVVIPEGIEAIERWCFFRKSLETITVPPGVKEINEAFCQCVNLIEIDLPDITTIGSDAFKGCSSLKRVVLGPELSKMGWHAFSGCTALEEISIPNSLKDIETGAFADCKSLKSVELKDGLERIGVNAFKGCRSLQKIEIPDTVTDIESDAFSACDALTRESIILPKHLSTKTYYGSSFNLDMGTEVDIYTHIGISDENHCLVVDNILVRYDGEDKNARVTDGITTIKQEAFLYNGIDEKPTTVILPNSIRKIENGALLDAAVEVDQSIFKTTEKLPSEVAEALGDDAETVAYTVIFQSGKPWAKAISKVLADVEADVVFGFIIDILNNKKESITDAAAGRVVNYATDHKDELKKENIDLLGDVLHTEEKKWKKSIQTYGKEFASSEKANEQHNMIEEAKASAADGNKEKKDSDHNRKEEIPDPFVFPSDKDAIIDNAISLYERIYNELSKKMDAYDATVIELPSMSGVSAGRSVQEEFYSRLRDYLAGDKGNRLYDRLTPGELYRSWTKDYGPGIGQVGLGLALGYIIAEYALCENNASGELVFCRDKWEYRGDYSSATRPALHIEPNINKWRAYNKRGYPKFDM